MGMLAGKVAIISGIGDGLGSDIAKLFAQEGAALVITARRTTLIDQISAEINQAGGSCCPLTCDITQEQDCARVVATALEQFGHIDILVNNAYSTNAADWLPLCDLPADLSTWRADFETNVFGTMKMARAVAPHMVERKSGRIVMINSMVTELLRAGMSQYSGSKAAQEKIAKTLALELAPHGIRVNCVHPGYMWGAGVEYGLRVFAEQNDTTYEVEKQKVIDQIPLGYIPPTAEYAGIVLFLASDLSLPLTGQSIHINGGQYIN
jgi:NAD(P)-dependent dehydrogenase (short-subunit alcohol dehydrogenase family)